MHVVETNRGGTTIIQFRPADTVMQDHHVPIVFLHLGWQGTCQMPSQVHNVPNGLERSHSRTVVLVDKIKYLILDQLRDVHRVDDSQEIINPTKVLVRVQEETGFTRSLLKGDGPEKIMHMKNHVTAQEAIEGMGDLMTGQNLAPRKPLRQRRHYRC